MCNNRLLCLVYKNSAEGITRLYVFAFRLWLSDQDATLKPRAYGVRTIGKRNRNFKDYARIS